MPNHNYKLIVNAPFINSGGGKTLLIQLFDSLNFKQSTLIIVDDRIIYNFPKNKNLKVIYSSKSIFNYFFNEFYIFRHSSKLTKILCFHGSPLIFRNLGYVYVYFQNTLHLEKINFFKLFKRLKNIFFIKSFYFADEIIVQTPSLERDLNKSLEQNFYNLPIKKLPFYSSKKTPTNTTKKYDFIYVADASNHKNQLNLLAAWIILAEENIKVSLVLTIPSSQFDKINQITGAAQKYNLKVYNFSDLSVEKVHKLYSQSRALIFPSLTESLGLPLIEASSFGLTILASELDYVRDVCRPDFTFNPLSPHSIAHAVKRSLDIQIKTVKIYKPLDLLNYILTSKNK